MGASFWFITRPNQIYQLSGLTYLLVSSWKHFKLYPQNRIDFQFFFGGLLVPLAPGT